MKKLSKEISIPIQIIERRIYIIRGEKVMLDSDLAMLYQVPTKRLNEAVRRNKDRFPKDFMFQLTKEEAENLRFQIGTSNSRSQIATLNRGQNIKYLPHVFTEHGVAMLSSVLNSKRAVQMNILIIRAFVKLRELTSTHKDLANKIEKIENDQRKHASIISLLASEIDKLKIPAPIKSKEKIGVLNNGLRNRIAFPLVEAQKFKGFFV